MCGEFERECEIKAAGIEGWGEEGFVERGLPGASASSDLGSSRIRRRDQLGGHGGQSRTMEVNPGQRSIQDHGGQSSLVLRLGGGEARSCRNPSLHPIPKLSREEMAELLLKGRGCGFLQSWGGCGPGLVPHEAGSRGHTGIFWPVSSISWAWRSSPWLALPAGGSLAPGEVAFPGLSWLGGQIPGDMG